MYIKRVQKLQDVLIAKSCDALLIEEPLNLFYLTGIVLSTGKLLIHSQGAHLLVDDRYFEFCQKNSPFPVVQESVTSFESFLETPELAFIHTLAFDSENTSYKRYGEILTKVQENGARKLKVIPLDNPVKRLRSLKDAQEIQILRSAAELGSKGFDYVCSLLCEGVTELQVATELEIFWKRHGAKSLGFDPIIAFGANSSMPHYRPGNVQLKKGQCILIDIGVNFQHYHSDMTRVAFYGEPDKEILTIYPIVQEAQRKAIEVCRPGISLGEVDAAARDFIKSKGYGAFFSHGLGHGVGLEIHEYPVVKDIPPLREETLAPGMVITIEPGIYLPGIGGVRIEDTLFITEHEPENLTCRSTEPYIVKSHV